MARQPIPFAEGSPPDDLQIEDFGDDEVLIGDPELDIMQDVDSEFDSNLAEEISEKELKAKASSLVRMYEEDREARSDWEERYKAGLRTVDPDGGMSEEEDARASRGLSTVVHPMIAEAATQFNARAIAELYPSGGPVKSIIVGNPDEEVEEQARIQFRSALSSLLGEENASEDLVTKLEAIFEAAVNDRVERTVAGIVQNVDKDVKTYLDNVTESLVEKVDDYLDFVVEEWMTDNAVAVEQGIKTQIAENFITGLKNLFENHYIDVPNEKYNVLDELYAQNRELETKLNESFNQNIALRKENELTECAGIFVAATRDLADTQISKLQSLMENVSFADVEEYRNKLVAIKENYLHTPKVSSQTRVTEPEETFSPVKGNPTTLVEGYVGALGRLNKKV